MSPVLTQPSASVLKVTLLGFTPRRTMASTTPSARGMFPRFTHLRSRYDDRRTVRTATANASGCLRVCVSV
jgi:hypothetical protein